MGTLRLPVSVVWRLEFQLSVTNCDLKMLNVIPKVNIRIPWVALCSKQRDEKVPARFHPPRMHSSLGQLIHAVCTTLS